MKATFEYKHPKSARQQLFKELQRCYQEGTTLNIKLASEEAYSHLKSLIKYLPYRSHIRSDHRDLYLSSWSAEQLVFIDLGDVPFNEDWKEAILSLQCKGIGLVLLSNQIWVSYISDACFYFEEGGNGEKEV